MATEIPKAYEPGQIERKWYEFWLKQGYFTPQIDWNKRPFVIIMPPPNVTGELHLGHALTATIEDIMVRWHRMKGEPVLWLPGTDHAGIATQVVVEQQLAKRGQTKNSIGRENFIKLTWEWANKSRDEIRRQHQLLGASCDWTREKFTLDEGPSKAVRTTFVRLFNKGLIYRGERMINWCPRCQTALSDLEVEHKDTLGQLYYICYPVAGGQNFVTVATTRPETFLGDMAVAVNPQDERYKHLVGKEVILPIINRRIPIIADDAVDIAFGTGALKITPAHDPTDFEIAQRHNLPRIDIMNPDATMNDNAGPYCGLDRFACRQKIVADLKAMGLLSKVEPYAHSVGHCCRCQTVVEPRVSLQWFVRTQPLAEAAIKVVKERKIRIIPERFTKVYFDWMENIKDWCISRQLWWGHRIPVWYCQECNKTIASVEEPLTCTRCNSKQIVQDPDVLDTWFSSALWTHSTLGWPEDTEDLRYFYPTSVMETGYDILFFWVARMIMMGLENMGEIPFHTVYLHGLIRDEKGEKMSKMRGNVINPVEAIGKYGVDALRFALTVGTSAGNDVNVGTGRLDAGRNFANKLWNAARFILQNMEATGVETQVADAVPQRIEDRWIYSQLNRLITDVTRMMEDFQFGEAEQEIYDFIWSKFCDWYIEIAKIRIRNRLAPSPLPFLIHTLESSLRLLHPFMPFITEELWQALRQYLAQREEIPHSIMIAPYPVASGLPLDSGAERVMECVMELVRAIRNIRAQYKVAAHRWMEAQVYADELLSDLVTEATIIEELAKARPFVVLDRKQRKPGKSEEVVLILQDAELVLPVASMANQVSQEKKLLKQAEELKARIARLENRLRDQAFLTKAPVNVVEKEREKLALLQDKLHRLYSELSQLSSKRNEL